MARWLGYSVKQERHIQSKLEIVIGRNYFEDLYQGLVTY
jgi:isocitrate dehydrogenase